MSLSTDGFLDQLSYPARFLFSTKVLEGNNQAHLFDQ